MQFRLLQVHKRYCILHIVSMQLLFKQIVLLLYGDTSFLSRTFSGERATFIVMLIFLLFLDTILRGRVFVFEGERVPLFPLAEEKPGYGDFCQFICRFIYELLSRTIGS